MARPTSWSYPAARERAQCAERLARLAFVDRDRRAWESIQSVIWQLMRRDSFRPTHPSDAEVLGLVFEAEDASVVVPAPSEALTLEEFCDLLDRDLERVFAERFDERVLDGFEVQDWRFVLMNFVPSGWDFTRVIALAAVQLPMDLAVPLYENAFDESGRGGAHAPHRVQFGKLMAALGERVPDLDRAALSDLVFLARVVPEAIAELNLWCRMLWSRRPGGTLGALYSVEASVPSYFAPLETKLRRLALDDDALQYIIGHQTTDVEHASQWRELIKMLIAAHPEERPAIYRGAMLSASWDVAAWQTVIAMWRRWKAGEPITNIGAWVLDDDDARAPRRAASA